MGYYAHSAYHQSKLLSSRISIDRALRSGDVTEEQKRKLRLVQEVKKFAENDLGLASTSNYTTFVQLKDKYVTYVVQAAYAWELKPYLWHFPLVGSVPYKGYFTRDRAEEEAKGFPKDEYDTYVRGVSAYSTLGWLQDSVLSSMLRYEDQDLVEVIIHETVHSTLYIKSAADFNERMATFLGQVGMKLFYQQKEGGDSKFIRIADEEIRDQKIFSKFISKELQELKSWYELNKGKVTPETKAARLREINQHFADQIKPQLKSGAYADFEKRELNNAFLLAYKTYEYDLDDFAQVYSHFHGDFKQTLECLKGLKKSRNPDQGLKDLLKGFSGGVPK
jgi:predicted aminopeptidase